MEQSFSKDPVGHIKLSVSNFKQSHDFYDCIFRKLGFTKISQKEESAGWVTREGFGIWISQAKHQEPKHVFSAPGLHHLCLKAHSIEEVDAVYKIVKDKTTIFDKPQAYPQYTEKYYAVFFSDPDSMKLEVAYY